MCEYQSNARILKIVILITLKKKKLKKHYYAFQLGFPIKMC